MSLEFKNPFCHSINNEKEEKSNYTNIDTPNLYRVYIKETQNSLKEKKSPETQSNSINNNYNIFNFTDYLYNKEEHLDDNQKHIIKINGNKKLLKENNNISPKETFNSKNKKSEKSRSSLELSNLSKKILKEQNLKKSLFNKNSNKQYFYNNNNYARRKSKRGSIIGNMTHKNRHSNHDFSFFFKLKEKDKIPSKTPYLDKIWGVTNNSLNFKPKTNIFAAKKNLTLAKQNSQEIDKSKISKINRINIKNNKEKNEKIQKLCDDKKSENKDIIEKEQIENNGESITQKLEKIDKMKLSMEKVKKANIILNILNKPFFCCLK